MPFIPYAIIVKSLLILLLISSFVWGVHTYNAHQQDIGYQRAVNEYKDKLIAAQEAARATEVRMNKQLEDANNAAIKRNKVIEVSAAAAQSANDSLLKLTNNFGNNLSSTSPATLANTITSISAILGECSTSATRLAEAADRWSTDAVRCVDSWPTTKE